MARSETLQLLCIGVFACIEITGKIDIVFSMCDILPYGVFYLHIFRLLSTVECNIYIPIPNFPLYSSMQAFHLYIVLCVIV